MTAKPFEKELRDKQNQQLLDSHNPSVNIYTILLPDKAYQKTRPSFLLANMNELAKTHFQYDFVHIYFHRNGSKSSSLSI